MLAAGGATASTLQWLRLEPFVIVTEMGWSFGAQNRELCNDLGPLGLARPSGFLAPALGTALRAQGQK